MKEKYLPIGSVVILKGAKKRIMITGYAQIDMEKKDKVYDYCGCLFPQGIISTENTLLFNHDKIEKIFAIGYSDDEGKDFLEKLKETLTEENMQKMLTNVQEEPESL